MIYKIQILKIKANDTFKTYTIKDMGAINCLN